MPQFLVPTHTNKLIGIMSRALPAPKLCNDSFDTHVSGSLLLLLLLPPRTFEYTIVSYFFLPTYLMRWPVVGALAAFPAAAMGAYSLRDIMSRPGVVDAMRRMDLEKAS